MSKANKSSVPELRFPEFKNAPAWQKKKLGDVSKISTGSSNRRDSTSNSGKYTFFDRSQDIRTSNIFLFDSEAIIVAGEGQNFIPKYFIGKFDLHQRTYAIMDFKKSLSKFIFYFIYQNKEYFLSQAVGSTVKSLRLPMFEKMVINLPKPKEQQKIADCLTSLDELIDAQSQKVDSLKQHKKGLMQQLFPQADTNHPKLRFPDFRNSPEWEEKKLGDISNKKSSNISLNKLEDNQGKYILYGAIGFIKNVDFYTEESEYIAILKDGAGVGRLLYCKSKTSVLGTLDIVTTKQNIGTKFLFLLLQNFNFNKYIVGSGIPHIYYKDYKNEKITLPKGKKEQQKIADCLTSIDELIDAQSQKLLSLKQHKKGLMQKLFPEN